MNLIIINPVSGKGNSLKIFSDKIKNYLKYYDLDNLYITKYKGHATEIILNTNIIDKKYIKNIILIGGDGLIHEVVQGLIQRNVYDKPIYIVPTGSGNGLAKSLNINNIDDAIKLISNKDNEDNKNNEANKDSKNQIKTIDLFKVSYNSKTEYSFLAQTWTMISDIDIDTEWLRRIGDLRYFWGILKFLFKNKSVKGELKYRTNNINKYQQIEGDFTLFCASNVPSISSDFKMLPYADMNDKLLDIIYIVNYTMTFFEKIMLLYYCLNGEHINKCKFINYVQASEYILTEIESKNTSYIVSDGEVINSKNIHVETSNKELTFIKGINPTLNPPY